MAALPALNPLGLIVGAVTEDVTNGARGAALGRISAHWRRVMRDVLSVWKRSKRKAIADRSENPWWWRFSACSTCLFLK